MSEIGLTGEMSQGDTGIEAIRLPLFFIPNDGEESLKIRELLKVSEEFEEEEADGIIGMSSYRGIG
jgi:hypothetical protein